MAIPVAASVCAAACKSPLFSQKSLAISTRKAVSGGAMAAARSTWTHSRVFRPPFQRLRYMPVQTDSASRGQLVEQGLLHERVRESVASRALILLDHPRAQRIPVAAAHGGIESTR